MQVTVIGRRGDAKNIRKFSTTERSYSPTPTEAFLDNQGRAGIISIMQWNLRVVKSGFEMNVCANPCGACIRTPANTGNIFEEFD